MSRLLKDWQQIYEVQPQLVWLVAALGFVTGVIMLWYLRRPYGVRYREAMARQGELKGRLEANRIVNDEPEGPPQREPSADRIETSGLFGVECGGVDPDRVVFIMDVSRSLTPDQFAMSKAELRSGLESLRQDAQYQVIFFSGPVWFAHQRIVEGGERGQDVVIREGEIEHRWKYAFGSYLYEKGNENLPSTAWRVASAEAIRETILDLEDVGKSDGTTWQLPLTLAMNLDPAPQQIFFMTDGETARQETIAAEMIAFSQERGNPVIHTIALMVPGASPALHRLACATGGRHALVSAGGHVLRDAELIEYLDSKGITIG